MDAFLLADITKLKIAGYSQADIDAAYNYTTPVVTPPVTGFEIGWNASGADASFGSALKCYKPAQTLNDFLPLGGLKYWRCWGSTPLTSAPPDSEFVTPRLYAAAGVKVIFVWNFQNSPNKKVPADEGVAYFNAMPPASQTGIWAVEIGNELDSSAYFADSNVNLAKCLAVVSPILRAKGYYIIMGNQVTAADTFNADMMKLVAPGVIDAIGGHFYMGSAHDALPYYTSLAALAQKYGKDVCCTEVGLHLAVQYAPKELALLWAGLRAIKGRFIAFTSYATNTGGGVCSALATPGIVTPNFAAYRTGLGL